MRSGPTSDRVWRSARTFEALCQAIALQLEGKLQPMPNRKGFRSSVLEETKPLIPILVALNRRGIMATLSSQPGVQVGITRQRAYVQGFILERARSPFLRLANRTGLVFGAARIGGRSSWLSVNEDEDIGPWADVGGEYWRWAVDELFGCLHPDLRTILKSSCSMAYLADPVWTRNTVLWPALLHVAWRR